MEKFNRIGGDYRLLFSAAFTMACAIFVLTINTGLLS